MNSFNINYANLLEGKWSKLEISSNYSEIINLNVWFKNLSGRFTIEFSLDFDNVSCLNEALGINSDCFDQNIKENTGVKSAFEIRKCLKLYSEELSFTVNGKVQRVMMTNKKNKLCSGSPET